MADGIAFALAGLGGFNAHGAGFLKAATELNVKPRIVTATSGQIIVLAEWLRDPKKLEELLINPKRPGGVLGTMLMAALGDPGIFTPATTEYWRRWTTFPMSPKDLADRLLPAQQYIPSRGAYDFRETADLFNDEKSMGVVFNAYDLRSGKEVLFGNDAARADKCFKEAGLRPITPDAVAAALWLSLYGFEKSPEKLMDGAYNRPCIVAELNEDISTIYAVRPLAKGWVGQVPRNWFDVQDWQCEMWFSAGYRAEVAELTRINKLIEKGALNHADYHRVELIEIVTKHPAGYFHFFTERAEVFEEAYRESRQKFLAHARKPPQHPRSGPPAPQPSPEPPDAAFGQRAA